MIRPLKFSITVLGLAAAVSCNTGFGTRTICVEEKYALTDGRTDSLDLSISVELPASGLSKEADARISAAITKALFGEDYMTMAPEDAMHAYAEDFADEYRAENLPMTSIEGLEDSSLDWAEYIEGRFVYVSEDVISYLADRYVYSGGAHGMSAESAYNFDRRTGTDIIEDTFFREGYVPELTRLLTARLPESLESPADTAMMFIREIGPNGNFSITESGITYIYNQYEIAPYSMGIIRISIPWEELDGLY